MSVIIQNMNNQSILKPQMQNSSLQNVINQINASVANRQNFDAVELSEKAQELLKESKAAKAKDKEPIIDYENSEMIQSDKWGAHTKAEFAEMSLDSQRNDLKTISDQIDYHKSKLEFTMEKIAELENYISGDAPHSELNITKETAEAYLHNYKQSITEDYADFTIGRSQYHADEFDKLSGGLASEVFENPLHSLNTEDLGLSNLSDDPKEIMKALDNASEMLDKMTKDLERAFFDATGGKEFTEPAKSWSIFGGDSDLSFFASQMETGYKMAVSDLSFTGETLEIDISSISELN